MCPLAWLRSFSLKRIYLEFLGKRIQSEIANTKIIDTFFYSHSQPRIFCVSMLIRYRNSPI